MKNITERQNEIMHFIADYTLSNSCPPTIREISTHFDIGIKAVQDHLLALEKKGYIEKTEKKSRSIRLKKGVDGQVCSSNLCQVPILGSTAAGKPIFCDENYEGTITLSEPFVKPGESYFALKVHGTSMINAGINDGDLAVIKKQEKAENGDIVVALLDDSVTLKRFFLESNRVRLQPENPDFKPIYTQDGRILGKLSHIIREY